MPYGRGEAGAVSIPPGPEVNRTAEGQQLYRNALAATRELTNPAEWTIGGALIGGEFLNTATPPVSPIGDSQFFDLTGAGVADTLSQVLTAAFDGGVVYIASLYVDSTVSTSTAARLTAVIGGVASTVDFIPQNGTIITTSGPGGFTISSFVVGNNTFLRVLIRVANPAAASPNSLTITPVIPPSVAGTLRVQAPMIAVSFDVALGLPANAALFTNPAYIESNETATGQFGISTPGALPQYQVAVPWQVAATTGAIAATAFLNFSGMLGKTLTFPPGAIPQSFIVPSATSGGLDNIPPGWYCWLTQGNQPAFATIAIDFAFGQAVYANGVEPLAGPIVVFPTALFPTSTVLLVYLGANEWAIYPTNARRAVYFPNAGAFSFAWPYGVDSIFTDGAGGGGGGGGALTAGGSGGGGGAGQAVFDSFISGGGPPGTLHAVTIGAGGAGGTGGAVPASGAAGAATSLGALLMLTGAAGGAPGAAVAGGNGGLSGGPGGTSGSVGFAVGNNPKPGGLGGSTDSGGAGTQTRDPDAVATENAEFGAGGGGGGNDAGGVGKDGGNGGNGFLTIRW